MKMLQTRKGRALPQTGSSEFPSPQSGIPALLIRTVGSETWFELAHTAMIATLRLGAWAPLSPQQPFLSANACLCQVQAPPGLPWLFPDRFSVTDTAHWDYKRGQDISRGIKGMPILTWIWRRLHNSHVWWFTHVILAVRETESRQWEFQGHVQTTLWVWGESGIHNTLFPKKKLTGNRMWIPNADGEMEKETEK